MKANSIDEDLFKIGYLPPLIEEEESPIKIQQVSALTRDLSQSSKVNKSTNHRSRFKTCLGGLYEIAVCRCGDPKAEFVNDDPIREIGESCFFIFMNSGWNLFDRLLNDVFANICTSGDEPTCESLLTHRNCF